MIKPTVGRIVWYRGGDDSLLKEAAIIVRVWDEFRVNLTVFGTDGAPRPETGVFMAQDDAPCPSEHYAEWMPYQKGQAAKVEALEAKRPSLFRRLFCI